MTPSATRQKWCYREVIESAIPAHGAWFACFGSWDPRDLVVWPILGWAIQRREQARAESAVYRDAEWEESGYPNREWMPIVSTPYDPLPMSAQDVDDCLTTRQSTGFTFLGTFRDDMSQGLREEFLARFEDEIQRAEKANAARPPDAESGT